MSTYSQVMVNSEYDRVSKFKQKENDIETQQRPISSNMKSIELNRCRSGDHRNSVNESSPIDLKAMDTEQQVKKQNSQGISNNQSIDNLNKRNPFE